MPRIRGSFRVTLVLLVFAGAVQAQSGAPAAKPNSPPRQPYTAEFKITHVQTLADGTTITRETTEIEARDSAGRSMNATTEETPRLGRAPGTLVRVNDPEGGVQASWDSRTKKARVFKLPAQDQRHGCWATDSGTMHMSWYDGPRPGRPAPNATPLPNGGAIVPALPRREKPQVEDLGTASIQGVETHGRRITRTIPVGEIGNDQTIVAVTEYWSAPSLGITVRESSDDPRTGKQTRELVSLSLDDPDPSVFEPPADYEVTTEELHPVACQDR